MTNNFFKLFLIAVTCPFFCLSEATAFNAKISTNSPQSKMPAILKADEITGDSANQIVTANGNVEIIKGDAITNSDQVIYDKNSKKLTALGNVTIKNLELGTVYATKAEVQDDFTSGYFEDSLFVFSDGSYMKAPKSERIDAETTVFTNPIYSICPNPEISEDSSLIGKKRDFISLQSNKTTIDRKKEVMQIRSGVIRVYDIPLLYTPYLSTSTSPKKKKTGFLHPSYVRSTNLGLGINLPFYLFIADNMDAKIITTLNPFTGLIISDTNFRHSNAFGAYNINLEAANNKLENQNGGSSVFFSSSSSNSVTVSKNDSQKKQWHLMGKGFFNLTNNVNALYDLDYLSDINYLRRYHNNFIGYTKSSASLNYIKNNDYHAVTTIKFNELEYTLKPPVTALPRLDSYVETKPMAFNSKLALTSNATAISRREGLQYRRTSFVPEFYLPLNYQGNLITFDAKLQADAYSLNNRIKSTTDSSLIQNYDNTETDSKPTVRMDWRLPMIKKGKSSTLLFEPIIVAVASSSSKSHTLTPNEDSNNTEITTANLFATDRISGYDRNELGKRTSYGFKSSLFNSLGEFWLTMGQSIKTNSKTQDVTLRGFNNNNNKSNIIGEFTYRPNKNFFLNYYYQLNESNYTNEVNDITYSLGTNKYGVTGDYLLLRQTAQNATAIEQATSNVWVSLTSKLKATASLQRDFITSRNIKYSVGLNYNGCCTTSGFVFSQTSPNRLIKPQNSISITFAIKNL